MDKNNKILYAPDDCKIKICKWRVREGFPVNLSQVILLYENLNCNDTVTEPEIKRLKSTKIGVVKKRMAKDGEIIEKGAPLLELSECIHNTVIKDMCADCGEDLRQNENGNTSEASVPMIHSVPDLKVTQKLAQQLGQADTKRLLEDRKLVLLVDLDQTIIHTTNDNVPYNIKGIYHFQLYGPNSPWYHTRLRPGTLKFLEQISKFYELHICTFGARNYAHTIAQFLDGDGTLFSHRILSRDECFNVNSKTDNLKALFPCGDSMVCIIDDREDVWNMASNLIQVKPYHFFLHTGDINAPPGLSKHELDGKGVNFKDLNNAINPVVIIAEEKDSDETIDVEKNSEDEDNSNIKVSIPKQENELEENKFKKALVETEKILLANINPNLNETDENIPKAVNIIQADIVFDNISVLKVNKESTQSEKKESLKHENLIEIEDADDYLLYLEVILKQIHKRFYEVFDDTNELPDLKVLVPKIRSKVLDGKTLVFSGLVSTNMKLEQSRAYLIAKSLGANVTQHLTNDTTHLVAVTAGTFKVNAARKRRDMQIVTPEWLWCCAERWEHVDEKLFPLDPTKPTSKQQRQPPAHCHSPEHVVNYNEKSELSTERFEPEIEAAKFIDTINPLLSFSNADLDEMNKEFDEYFESDSSSDDEPVNIENPPLDKKLLKRKRAEQGEERQRTFFSKGDEDNQPFLVEDKEQDVSEKNSSDDDDDEPPSLKFRRGGDIPSDLDAGSNSGGSEEHLDEEDDGEWNMMGAALEREFLGLED